VEDLKGKVVLITGASTGIGAAAARAFGAHGSRVAVHYNASREAAERVVGDIRATGADAWAIGGDVTVTANVDRIVAETAAHFGRIDVLVNNAGGLLKRVPVVDLDEEIYARVLDLNVRSVVMATRAVVPHMRRTGGGNIINVTSVAARHGGGPGSVLYAGAKGFVSTWTRGMAKELVKDNIRVNGVSPGVIATPFHERYSTPQMIETMRQGIPMGRVGLAEECAGAFLYFASDRMSGYVTGQILEVNGGQFMP
jgi:3-oxoacyl-[acyl-carrier protein] reductase